MNRKDIKARAKEIAFKNKWNIIKPLLVIYAISFIVGLVVGFLGLEQESFAYKVFNLAYTIAVLPLTCGYTYYVMELVKGNNISVKDALLSKFGMFGLILAVWVVVYIQTIFWTLLLIIPGIIFAFSMSMTNYILADEGAENMSRKEIMAKSKQMMDGHKMEYFVFGLSFLGWMLLGALTLGIVYIWAIPYMMVAQVIYYQDLKKLTEAKDSTLEQIEQ